MTHTEKTDGSNGTEQTTVEPVEPQASQAGANGNGEHDQEVTPEQIAQTGKEFVAGLLTAMGLQGDVSTRLEDERAVIDVAGDDLGVLIGRRGQTLDALQEVTRTAVQRRLRSRVRLLVDVEGYRSRRRESLTEYARSMAQRAMERGTEIELEPMNAYERKLVHDAVADIEGASSYSEGEEPNRKVIVRGD
ncbi:MAG: RNA-binding cell elongation regulator Jag/EloR [Actinomycetota bacterium]